MKYILILLFSVQLFSQDERFYREFFAKKKIEKTEEGQKLYDWKVFTNIYRYDIDGDGFEEGIQAVKKDVEDWVYIYRSDNSVRFKAKLDTWGRESFLQKIKINQLSKSKRLLTLYFYEGFTKGHELYGRTRLYFITLDESVDQSLKLTKGPAIWLEQKIKTRYMQREHNFLVRDIDQDGSNEVIVSYGSIHRIYKVAFDGSLKSSGI